MRAPNSWGRSSLAIRSLLYDVGANLAVRALGVITSFALTVVLARLLGAAEFGRYAVVIAIVTVLAIPAQAGVSELVLRETAKAQFDQRWSRMRGIWSWATKIVVATSVAVLLAGIALSFLLGRRPADVPSTTFLVAILFVPLAASGSIRGAILRGLGHVVAGLLPEYIVRPLVALCASLAYVAVFGRITANEAIHLYVLAAAIALALGAILLQIYQPKEITRNLEKEYDASQWQKSAVVLALMAGMSVLLQQVDILMLGMFSSDEQVGIYRVAAQCSLVVSFGLTATLSAVAPHITRAHVAGNIERIRMLVVYSARFTAAIAIFPLILFAAAGEPLLSMIFGGEFSAASTSLMVLALSQAAVAIAGPVSVLLVMTGHERVSAKIMVITLGINICGNVLLIPSYGAVGAALGTGIAIIVQHFLLSIAVKDRLGFFGTAFSSAR